MRKNLEAQDAPFSEYYIKLYESKILKVLRPYVHTLYLSYDTGVQLSKRNVTHNLSLPFSRSKS